MWQQEHDYSQYKEKTNGEGWVAIEELLKWAYLAGPRMMTTISDLRPVKRCKLADPNSKQDSYDQCRKPDESSHLVLAEAKLLLDPEVSITICANN